MILTVGSACIFNYWTIIAVNTKGVLGTGGVCHIGMVLTKGGQGDFGDNGTERLAIYIQLYKHYRRATG